MKKLLILCVIVLAAIFAFANTVPKPGPVPQKVDIKSAPMLYKAITYAEVQPVFINNCSGCHNASTPNMNWLSEKVAINNKDLIFNRVFEQGDMPMWFKYFGFSDKELLRRWLLQEKPTLDEDFVEKVTR